MKLSHQVHELPEDFLMGCFIGGLRDAIKYEIIAKNPDTIEEAMRLARVEEERIANQRRGVTSTFQKHDSSSGAIGGGGGSAMKLVSAAATPHPHTPIKRLSSQELREKREKGLQFHCDEKYVAEHRCQNKKLFRLEICPEGEEEHECGFEKEERREPQPPIELTANLMASVMGVSSIRLTEKILV